MYGENAADRRGVSSIADIVDPLDTGIIVLDAEGVAISANDAACRILGVPAAAVVGRRPPFPGHENVFFEDGRRVDTAASPAVATLADGRPRTDVVLRLAAPDEDRWVTA